MVGVLEILAHGSWLGSRSRLLFGRIGLGLRVERADLELLLVLLENACVVKLPELLGGVLASDLLQDLLAT
jgi:hypothetical protein